MAATMQRRTRRAADAAKWTELFSKAVREGVQVRRTGSGLWIATSGTDRQAAYVVSLHECECPGHAYHGYCKHRALLAWTLGGLTINAPEPEPPTPAAKAGAGPGLAAGLTPAQVVALKGDAMRQHVYHGAPLIHPLTGDVIAEAA